MMQRSLREYAGTVAVAMLMLIFVLFAAERGVASDEFLVLRSGWLAHAGLAAEPWFMSPLVWVVGAIAHRIDDPGLLFLALRIATALLLLATLWYAIGSARLGPGASLLAVGLALTCGPLLQNGPQFRLEWAVMIGLLAGYALLVRDRVPGRAVLLGLVVVWLASHHTLGILAALGLYVLSLWAPDRVATRSLHSTIGVATASWLVVLWACGLLPSTIGAWAASLQVGSGFDPAGLRITALSIVVDAPEWWLTAIAGAALAVQPSAWRSVDAWTVAFLLLALLLLAVAPTHSPVLLALVVPFLAMLAARGWSALWEFLPRPGLRSMLAGASVLLAIPFLSAGRDSLVLRMDGQVETLRLLKTVQRPDDRVFDPTGFAYFMAPVDPAWLIDGSLQVEMARGRWLQDSDQHVARADWVINGVRLDQTSDATIAAINSGFEHFCGGMLLAKGDVRWREASLCIQVRTIAWTFDR